MPVSRRELLRSLGATVVVGSTLCAVPAEAAAYAHRMVSAEKATSTSGGYTAKFFSAHQYETLRALCRSIIPPDADSGGALEAGAPEFIDLLTSENKGYQKRFGDGILWLDSTCTDRHGKSYLECTPVQQEEILNQIAFRKNANNDSTLLPGVEFFAALRTLTADGYFTSEVGIKYLGYIGNAYVKEFPGCPEIPGA